MAKVIGLEAIRRLTGNMIWANADTLEDCEVREAVSAKGKLSIDWIESGRRGHLETVSSDGVHFQGNHGYPKRDKKCFFNLKAYESGDEILLFGIWRDSGLVGKWIFILKKEED